MFGDIIVKCYYINNKLNGPYYENNGWILYNRLYSNGKIISEDDKN